MNISSADFSCSGLETVTIEAAAQGLFKRTLINTLRSLQECELTFIEGSRTFKLGTTSGDDILRTTIRVNDPEVYRSIGLGGSNGVAESFMRGEWQCEDLVTLVRIFVRNRDLLDRMDSGIARAIGGTLARCIHFFRRNTKTGSAKNIAAHYDLGNDLFRLFLDSNLMYSSAIYVSENDTLDAAATRKLDRICQKLDLQAHHRIIEIGTGWGGFALHAAKTYGCHVTTTTISKEQFDLATQRIAQAGLQDKITVLLQDYRELDGQFDRLVSIEMIEAIGHQYLETYFAKVSTLLKADGMALIQAITIEDHRYERALKDVDFIKRYIFPGSFIPSISAMLGAAAKQSIKLINLEDIGNSYALTLRAWRDRFVSSITKVRALGYDEAFCRMWFFYLAYCEGGFLERSISDVQILLAKPRNLRKQYLPDLAPTL
jgi:cyclopropane-fatty-acyl-phospholipid synthase